MSDEKLKPLEAYTKAGSAEIDSLVDEMAHKVMDSTNKETAYQTVALLRGMRFQMMKMNLMIELLYRMQPTNLDTAPVVTDIVWVGIDKVFINDLKAFLAQLIGAFDHTRRQYPIQAVPPFDVNQWSTVARTIQSDLYKQLGEKP